MTDDLRYPIGKFTPPADYAARRSHTIARLARIPASMRLAICDLSDAQTKTPYRPGGWTVRQLVHHVADSHMNFYVRLKLALTEDVPTIKPYAEEPWALLEDSHSTPVSVSLSILDGVHERADRILRAIDAPSFAREYIHPVGGRNAVDYLIAMYAWHGEHHVAHITALRAREGWG
jgi:DinB superfamily